MEAGFLRHNIEFAPGEPIVSMASRGLNAVGNFLLSPARHLFNGRTVTAISVYLKKNETDKSYQIHYSETTPTQLESGGKKFLKTIASIICFVPGIIFGSAVKGLALATSSSLRAHYTYFPPPPIPQPKPKPQPAQTETPISQLPLSSIPPVADQFPGIMKEEDKQKFRDMGIIFDSKGKVTHYPPQYKVEQEHISERVWLVTISSKENQRLVRIQTDTPPEETAIESVSIWDKR